MRSRIPRIAVAQIKYFNEDDSTNLPQIKKYISLAKKKGADIICFPESCVTRWGTMDFNHSLIKEIRLHCLNNNIWAIINDDFIIEGKPYNTSVLIDRKGRIAGYYQKINLYGDGPVEPGGKVKVFNTDFAKIGIVTCWDLAFQDLFMKMKRVGAEIVLCPMRWRYERLAHANRKYDEVNRERERDLLRSITMTRSFENLLFLAIASPYIEEKDMINYSAILSPHKTLAEIYRKEGLITADLDLKEIHHLHKLYHPERVRYS